MRLITLVATALCVAGAPLAGSAVLAQSPDTTIGPVLTLDQAISLAIKNNPNHLKIISDRRTAGARLRSAYGALLPSADASLQGVYRQQGSQLVSGFSGFSSGADVYQSSYWIGLTYRLNTATFLNPRIQSANVNAAEADIAGSTESVRAAVAQQYLTVLQSQANAALQDSLVKASEVQLELAKAKLAVGSGTQLDVSRAEVNLGTQQVAAIRAHNQVEIDLLRLFQQMGVRQPANVQLVSQFEVREPGFALDSVLGLARRQNPTLNALRSRERVSSLSVKSARSEYLPNLTLSTGWGGYTNQYTDATFPVDQARAQALQGLSSCLSTDSLRVGVGLPSIAATCRQQYNFTDADARAIREANDQFPFNFTKQPFQFTATFSLPLFDGFVREQRIEEAQASRNQARYNVRAQELQLTADVTSAYLTLVSQAKTVALQEQTAAKAREELRLAEERYRVGAATFLDISDARASFERAESDRINAIYEYHKAFAALESAVGRPLR